MFQPIHFCPANLASATVAMGFTTVQPTSEIENELVLITSVAKTLFDPALAEFVKYRKEKWNITVKTSALAAGNYSGNCDVSGTSQ